MANHSKQQQGTEQPYTETSYNTVDYAWFATRFENLLERMAALENTITTLEQSFAAAEATLSR